MTDSMKREKLKALVLAAGRGSRIKFHSRTENKCMLQLFGKPLIYYSLENAVLAGAEEIVVIVGFQAEPIVELLGFNFQGVQVRYVRQHRPTGVVDAMACARTKIGMSDFILFLGDEIVWRPQHQAMLRRFRERDLLGACGVVVENDPAEISKTYAVIDTGSERRISQLVEKPAHPKSEVQGTGNCIFRAHILNYVEATPVNRERRERELPDLIQCAIDDGHLVEAFEIGAAYANINTLDDIRSAIIKDRRLRNARLTRDSGALRIGI